MHTWSNARIALITLAALGGPAMAQEDDHDLHGSDIELTVENEKIITSDRVYGAELGDIGVPNETDSPGFDSAAGTFDPGAPVGFRLLDALRKWDGEDFDMVADETLSVTFSTLGPITTPDNAGETIEGFAVDANEEGSFHKHLFFTLNSPASDGIYRLEMDLFSEGLIDSDPFFLVFDQNNSEMNHDAAIDFTRAQLDGGPQVIPEPATLGVLGLGGIGLLIRRRRPAR